MSDAEKRLKGFLAYSPTERPSDIIFSIAAAANGVNLFFFRGASLADPKKVLQGAGRQVRFVRVPSVGRGVKLRPLAPFLLRP